MGWVGSVWGGGAAVGQQQRNQAFRTAPAPKVTTQENARQQDKQNWRKKIFVFPPGLPISRPAITPFLPSDGGVASGWLRIEWSLIMEPSPSTIMPRRSLNAVRAEKSITGKLKEQNGIFTRATVDWDNFSMKWGYF